MLSILEHVALSILIVLQIKEQWMVINAYRNRSGVSWDYTRGGFFASSQEELTGFRAHCDGLKTSVRHSTHSCWCYRYILTLSCRKRGCSRPSITRRGRTLGRWMTLCQSQLQAVNLLMMVLKGMATAVRMAQTMNHRLRWMPIKRNLHLFFHRRLLLPLPRCHN